MLRTRRRLGALVLLLLWSGAVSAGASWDPQTQGRRPVTELLVAPEEQAWRVFLEQGIAEAAKPVQVQPRDPQSSRDTLYAMQITTRSTWGAVIYETGGLVVDSGWIRVLGGGGDLLTLNGIGLDEDARIPGWTVVAYDALGGRFVLNNGGIEGVPGGEIGYIGPSSSDDYVPLGVQYTDFLYWAMNADTDSFYRYERPKNYRELAAELAWGEAYKVRPTVNMGRANRWTLARREWRSYPVEEVFGEIDFLRLVPGAGYMRFGDVTAPVEPSRTEP